MLPLRLLLACGLLGAVLAELSGHVLYRFRCPENLARQLRAVSSKDIDFWSRKQGAAVAVVAPGFRRHFLKLLRLHDIQPEVLEADLQKAVNLETASHESSKRAYEQRAKMMGDEGRVHINLDVVPPFENISAYLHLLSETHPEKVTLLQVATTYENRSLEGVKISLNSSLPIFLITAGIHAREWIAHAVAVNVIDSLVYGYSTDERVKFLLDNFQVIVVPCLNPDGFVYSMTGGMNRFWRKTRSKPANTSSQCYGVDGNRNFDVNWAADESSTEPCSEAYAGPHPLSESETRGFVDFLKPLVPQVRFYVDLHSYMQAIMFPWACQCGQSPLHENLHGAATAAVEVIQSRMNVTYKYGRPSDLLYPASGVIFDYVHKLGVPYTYTVELGSAAGKIMAEGFLVDVKDIRPTAEHMLHAFHALAQYDHQHPSTNENSPIDYSTAPPSL